jgi:hypothetical protein
MNNTMSQPQQRRSARIARLLACGLCAPALGYAQAQPESADTPLPTPTTWRTTAETWELPGGEKMGMLGGNLLFDTTDYLKLGIGSYGAVRGMRGGFITLGLAAELQPRLSPAWRARAGLFVGAGGGRGGATLAGGGLMLRTDLGLSYESAGFGNFGFGLSHVNFPSGVIRSTQPYVLYEYPFHSLTTSGWRNQPSRPRSPQSLPANEQEFALVARSYRIPSSVVQDDGKPQYGSMQLLGVEWLSYVDKSWFVKLESEGAMGGRSNGYMQILAGGGYRLPLGTSTALKLHAAAGPAGGGRVDTGGGLLLDAGLGLQQQLTPSTSVEVSIGQVRAPSQSFRATSVALKLSHRFGLPAVGGAALPGASLDGYNAAALRVRAAQQTYSGRNPQWRANFSEQEVGNLGVQVDYFMSQQWFLSGQGLAAYSGKAGAYMKGLVGLGYQQPVAGPWFAEAEALVGAAGGGGLAVGGGLVAQANASLGYRLNKSLSLMATAGRIQASRGDFNANVLGVSLGYQFTGFAGL